MSDYVFLSADSNTEVLTQQGIIFGLAASRAYDIYLYGQGDNFLGEYSDGQNALVTFGDVSKQTSWDGIAGGDGVFTEGIEYVRFSVLSDLTGTIRFSYANVVTGVNALADLDGVNSRFAAINGLQIVDTSALVPEPSVALLGGLGLLCMLRRRR